MTSDQLVISRQVKFEAAIKAQARQREKQRAKWADPDHRAAHQVKQREAAQRAQQKQLEKQRSPAYRQHLFDKMRTKQASIKRNANPKKAKSRSIKKRTKGRSPSAHEQLIADKLGTIGCIACLNQGWIASDATITVQYVSLHHCDGRVKPFCHYKQLPLCQWHHQVQPPNDAPKALFPFHDAPKQWQIVNGQQDALLAQCYEIIGELQPWLAASS